MVEVPIFWKLIQRKVSPKPSIFFSNTLSKASGVTSRPVTPVPPVEITTSISGSAIQVLSWATIAGCSSLTMVRALSACPSRAMRSTSAWPEVSFAAVRESETVITAIWTGLNGRASSILAIVESGTAFETGDAASVRSGRHLLVLAIIDGRGAGCHGVQRRRRLPKPVLVDPIVGHHPLDEQAGFARRQGLDEEQRIVIDMPAGTLPLLQVAGAGIVGR